MGACFRFILNAHILLLVRNNRRELGFVALSFLFFLGGDIKAQTNCIKKENLIMIYPPGG